MLESNSCYRDDEGLLYLCAEASARLDMDRDENLSLGGIGIEDMSSCPYCGKSWKR